MIARRRDVQVHALRAGRLFFDEKEAHLNHKRGRYFSFTAIGSFRDHSQWERMVENFRKIFRPSDDPNPTHIYDVFLQKKQLLVLSVRSLYSTLRLDPYG